MAPDVNKLKQELGGLKLRVFDIPREACVTRCGVAKQGVCERLLEQMQKDEKAGKEISTPLCPFGWWNVDDPKADVCLCPQPEFPQVTKETIQREYYTKRTNDIPNNFVVTVVPCDKCKKELHLAQVIDDEELASLKTPPPAKGAKDVLPEDPA